MKKQTWVLMLSLAVMVSCSNYVFAEDMQGMESGQPQGQGGGMQGKMGGKMNPMMMGMMHKDTMVASSDGGVIVLSGPRLVKYDKDLNLVKEVELPRGKKGGPGQGNEPSGNENQEPPPPE